MDGDAEMMTEDEVRQKAGKILGFADCTKAVSGTGQITTFNLLGFKGVSDKPDGWYLPKMRNEPAIVLETKSSRVDISRRSCIDELKKNTDIVATRYAKVVGILYNGTDVIVTKNGSIVDAASDLQPKDYYLSFFDSSSIDRQHIYMITQRINNALHIQFGISNLYHRMIFTACALVAERYDADLRKVKNLGYDIFKRRILDTLSTALRKVAKGSDKLQILLDVYGEIEMDTPNNQSAINDFIDCVVDISESTNSDRWNGEDVMAIFFNEFNRYKGKSEHGQVFTPDHITSFMYRLIGVGMNDRVLDAACGSGAFLVKAMCNMIREAGGVKTPKAAEIKTGQLFGIEKSRVIFALACANMLIHKDGWTNLAQMDSRFDEAAIWIKSKGITKVLMNPPFETKYGCVKIVVNVLDSVPKGTLCAFIMPDKKLEKDKSARKMLKRHSLIQIVKLPEKVFDAGVTTSVFVFETGVPQGGKKIFACYMAEDGLEAVKNQGRHDVHGRWQKIEDYWIDAIYRRADEKYKTGQWLDPAEHLYYQTPERPCEITSADFRKTAMNYLLFSKSIDAKTLFGRIAESVAYGSDSAVRTIPMPDRAWCGNDRVDVGWSPFPVGKLFEKVNLAIRKPDFNKRRDISDSCSAEFSLPLVNAKHGNNGIMFYGKPEDFESEEMTLDIVKNGAIATGDVYAQPQRTGVLWDAYLVKPKDDVARNTETLLFLATVLQRTIKDKFSYDDKCIWPKVSKLKISLPAQNDSPDWASMHSYMKRTLKLAEMNLNRVLLAFPG